MSKPKKIRYNYSGKTKDVRKALRQFSANDVLKRIGAESIKLFQQDRENDLPAVRFVDYPIYKESYPFSQNQTTIITAWGLINLAYYVILYSNDYVGKTIEYDEEFYMLYDAVEGMRQRCESNSLDSENDPIRKIFYVWGFAGEQFKMEQVSKVFENAGRELYILFESSKKIPDFQIDVENIVLKESGFEWKKILTALFLGCFCFTSSSNYQAQLMLFRNNDILSAKEYMHIINQYACTYKDVRSSSLKRQIFYTKSYVKTQKDELLSISPYLNLFLYEHSIFWIIRNYYLKQKDQNFPSYFGQYFEAYFNELLKENLNTNEFERIREEQTKRADWKLNIGSFRFIIEQKSTIMRLAIKQQESDITAIEDFTKKTVIKALRQLQNTENYFNDGKYIKIVLLYDDYMKSEFIDQVFDMSECDIISDDYYWLVSIEEMEMLLPLEKTDADLFNKIITEKISRELAHSKNGKSLLQILRENGVTRNSYLRQEKFLNYINLAQKESKKIFE